QVLDGDHGCSQSPAVVARSGDRATGLTAGLPQDRRPSVSGRGTVGRPCHNSAGVISTAACPYHTLARSPAQRPRPPPSKPKPPPSTPTSTTPAPPALGLQIPTPRHPGSATPSGPTRAPPETPGTAPTPPSARPPASAPAVTSPRRASGSTTRQNACPRLHPSVSATCSCRGLIWSNVTRIVRTANAVATVNCASTTLGTANVTRTPKASSSAP